MAKVKNRPYMSPGSNSMSYSPIIPNAEYSPTLYACILKAAYAVYLMSIQVYKINSNPVGKYSDMQHCMHGHEASFKYQVL